MQMRCRHIKQNCRSIIEVDQNSTVIIVVSEDEDESKENIITVFEESFDPSYEIAPEDETVYEDRAIKHNKEGSNIQSIHNGRKRKTALNYNRNPTPMSSNGVYSTTSTRRMNKRSIKQRKAWLDMRRKMKSEEDTDKTEKAIGCDENVVFHNGSNSIAGTSRKIHGPDTLQDMRSNEQYEEASDTDEDIETNTEAENKVKKRKKILRFQCKICHSILLSGDSFNDHLRSHRSDYEMEECNLCKRTMNRKDLRNHKNTLHRGKVPGHLKCSECDKEYLNANSLHKHYTYHHKEFGFVDLSIKVCEVCGRKCRGNNAFGNHQRTHTGEKPFLCTVCPKSFRIADSLKRHMRVHTGEKPMTCKHCGKEFAHRYAHWYHLQTHTGAKPLSCEHCGKGFISKSNMKVHYKACSVLKK